MFRNYVTESTTRVVYEYGKGTLIWRIYTVEVKINFPFRIRRTLVVLLYRNYYGWRL